MDWWYSPIPDQQVEKRKFPWRRSGSQECTVCWVKYFNSSLNQKESFNIDLANVAIIKFFPINESRNFDVNRRGYQISKAFFFFFPFQLNSSCFASQCNCCYGVTVATTIPYQLNLQIPQSLLPSEGFSLINLHSWVTFPSWVGGET